jgi:hypothetical protein
MLALTLAAPLFTLLFGTAGATFAFTYSDLSRRLVIM